MADLARKQQLFFQAPQGIFVSQELGFEQLQRNVNPKVQIVGAIHHTHPSPPEEPDDPIARSDHLPGLQTRRSQGVLM
jgi:hypothetical protein